MLITSRDRRYYIAFASFYLQCPGLFGEDGITPVAPYLTRLRQHTGVSAEDSATWAGTSALVERSPSLVWFAAPLDVSLDAWVEGLSLLGVGLSLFAILGVHHAGVFAMLWLLYLSLYACGQSMLSFQWDSFLLETGFAAILYAPFVGGSSPPLPPVQWLLRFQLFKIMFMSGIVKTQANCPTWKGLTALEFHFASQCIPTAEAWWAHQLPPFLLRIGVGATFMTQIPGIHLGQHVATQRTARSTASCVTLDAYHPHRIRPLPCAGTERAVPSAGRPHTRAAPAADHALWCHLFLDTFLKHR